MCLDANVRKPEQLTASKQRHRISTIYASFEVPETEREFFYSHMGHSKSVNVGTYQYPLPIQEVIKVGRHLQDIDSGTFRREQAHQSTLHDNNKNVSTTTSCMTEETSTLGDVTDEGYNEEHETMGCKTKPYGTQRREQTKIYPLLNSNKNSPTATSSITEEANTFGAVTDECDNELCETMACKPKLNGSSRSKTINQKKCTRDHEQESLPAMLSKPKQRCYYRWSVDETALVKHDFNDWICLSEGNSMPGRQELEEYIRKNKCRFDHKTLRNKIMNEQNTRRKLIAYRMSKMENNS